MSRSSQGLRKSLGKLARAANVPRRWDREPYTHWLERSAQLSFSQLRDPDPLSKLPTGSGSTDIDVVIPVGPRDVEMVEHTVEGVRRNVAGPIGGIWCVAPPDVCTVLEGRFADINVVDEREVCGNDLTARLRSRFGDRAGWITQQIISLSTPEVTEAEAALVLDVDTVLLRPRRFRVGQKTLLLTEREFHIPYYEALARLWREPLVLPPFSCIAHHMCFLREDVFAMREAIEGVWQRPWIEAILECADPNEYSSFADYELYGQWRLKTARGATFVRPARNVSRRRPVDAPSSGTRAYSASYHWHLSGEPVSPAGDLGEQAA